MRLLAIDALGAALPTQLPCLAGCSWPLPDSDLVLWPSVLLTPGAVSLLLMLCRVPLGYGCYTFAVCVLEYAALP